MDSGGAGAHVVTTAPALPLDRIEAGKKLAVDILSGLPADQARTRLHEILQSPPRHPWWLRIIGVVLFSAGFAPSVAPQYGELAAAIGLGAVMAVLFVGFSGRRWEPLLPLIDSVAVGVLALTVFHTQAATIGPVLLMVPALFVVIPGDYLSAAVAELAVGRISAGATRLVWALVLLAQLVIGVMVAAQITGTRTERLLHGTKPGSFPFWFIVLAWVPFTFGLAWAFNASLRNVPLMAVITIGTYLVYAAMAKIAGDLAGTLVAATTLGLAATTLARHPHRPPRLELLVGGFFVLTVGSLGLRGVTALLSGHHIAGNQYLGDFIVLFPAVSLGLLAGFLLSGSPVVRWTNCRIVG